MSEKEVINRIEELEAKAYFNDMKLTPQEEEELDLLIQLLSKK